MTQAARYYLPTEIITGVGCFQQLGQVTLRCGRRALLVGGPGRHALLEQGAELIVQAGGEASLYTEVRGEPTIDLVDALRALALREGAEVIIGIGGGSAIDAAKATAGLFFQPGSTGEYQAGRRLEPRRGLPFIAVPTTAGSGAEVTRNAVLVDPRRGIKESIRDDGWFAAVALVDPSLTLDLPPVITAATGADALCQAVEAFTSTGAGPLSDSLAMDAIARIGRSLRRAVAEGNNLQARSDMLYGSLQAGMAMTNARLGAVHGLAHPLGARYALGHGVLCGTLLPYVMAYNLSHATTKYAHIARLLGLDVRGLDERQTAERAVEHVRGMLAEAGIPQRLGALGVRAEHFDELVVAALQQSSLSFNPRPLQAEDVRAVLEQAL